MIATRLDLAGFGQMAALRGRAADAVALGAARAISHVAGKAQTQMRRETARQTALPYGVMMRALKLKKATAGNLEAVIRSRGGNLSLRNYKPRETAAGVSARLPGGVRVIAGSFLKGGRFPKRVPLRMGGHVFARQGAARLPITLQRTGYFIPEEMVGGGSARAFHAVARADLGGRLAHEIKRLF